MYYTVLYYIKVYSTVLYCIMLYHTVSYCVILYYTVLYYIILYYTVRRGCDKRGIKIGACITKSWSASTVFAIPSGVLDPGHLAS